MKEYTFNYGHVVVGHVGHVIGGGQVSWPVGGEKTELSSMNRL